MLARSKVAGQETVVDYGAGILATQQLCPSHVPCMLQSLVATCRYERASNEMLERSTVAGQEGVVDYLANAAALQQFEQASLAYLLLFEGHVAVLP